MPLTEPVKVATVQHRLQQLQPYATAAQQFATQILGCSASAADACQSSLEKALTTSHYPTDPIVLKSWFFQVVRHQCLDQLRRRSLVEMVPNDEQANGIDSQFSSANLSPDQLLQQQQMTALMQLALQQLPRTQAEILWLREVNDFSYQQLADILAVEPGTVMSRIHRARLALRSQLAKIIALEEL